MYFVHFIIIFAIPLVRNRHCQHKIECKSLYFKLKYKTIHYALIQSWKTQGGPRRRAGAAIPRRPGGAPARPAPRTRGRWRPRPAWSSARPARGARWLIIKSPFFNRKSGFFNRKSGFFHWKLTASRRSARPAGKLCIRNDEFCIKNDEFCIKSYDGFCRISSGRCTRAPSSCSRGCDLH